MKFKSTMTSTILGLLCATGAAAVPDTFLYIGDLQEDGAPADGNFSVTFQMFNDRVAGTKVFEESVVSLPVVDGVLLHELGTAPSNALDDAELAAGELFLSVVVNGTVLEPRVAIRSVPFATEASNATNLGGTPAAQFAQTQALVGNDGIVVTDGSFALGDGAIQLEKLEGAEFALLELNAACAAGNIAGHVVASTGSTVCGALSDLCPAGQLRNCAVSRGANNNTCSIATVRFCNNFPIGRIKAAE